MTRPPSDRRFLYLALVFMALAAVVLSFVNCASSGVTRSLQAGVVASQVADVTTTHLAISSGQGKEGNVFMPSAWWQQSLIKAPVTLGLLWASTQIEERGHPVLARVFLGAVAGGLAVVASRNYSIARQP